MSRRSAHPEVDIAYWKTMFPVATLRQKAAEFASRPETRRRAETRTNRDLQRHIQLLEPHGEQICPPESLAVVEQLRDEVLQGRLPDLRVPTDVFVFAKGEPPDAKLTKVGGKVLWPSDQPQASRRGKSARVFLAQVYFGDSTDIVSELPGDLLIITTTDPELVEPDRLEFHWFSTSRDPVAHLSLGDCDIGYFPCHGHIHRTWDFPHAEHMFERYRGSHYIAVFEGTKIGGYPSWIQDDETPADSRFICSVGSTEPGYAREWGLNWYPFINQPEPFKEFPKLQPEPLMFGDVGSLYVFLLADGTTQGIIQCY